MSVITIDHHRSCTAACQNCAETQASGQWVTVTAVLVWAAEHAIVCGHTVTEHVTDDAVVHPEVT